MNPLYKILAGFGLAAALLGGTFFFGYQSGQDNVQAKWAEETQQETAAQSQALIKNLDDSYRIGLIYEDKKSEISRETEVIIKKIPVYIKDDSRCSVLPSGFGLLYNESASIADGDPAFRELDDAGAAALLDRQPK